jgi:tetrapyrrole methylase family protein/MazG family protein
MMEPSDRAIGKEIAALRRTLRTLRGPGGCPWDRERDIDDMISYLIEESYELLQAEKGKSWRHVEEELGDVFFIVIFIHELLLEKRKTPLEAIVARVHEKIVNRHPHVFGTTSAANSSESLAEWDRMKRSEKRKRPASGLLSGIPAKLPPLRRAAAVQRRAAGIGFDWPDCAGILDKLREEIDELATELRHGSRARIKDEVGDILFTAVNLARYLKVDPESVLEGTTEKFVARFDTVERKAKRSGKELSSMSLDEMERLWQESKERRSRRAARKRS